MSFTVFLDWLTLLAPVVLGIGLLIGLWKFPSLGTVNRLIVAYFLIGLLVDLLSRYLATKYGNNLILIPAFGFLELLIFSFIYLGNLLDKRNNLLKVVALAGAVYIVYECIQLLAQPSSSFQSYGRVVDGVILISFCLKYYLEQFQKDAEIEKSSLQFNAGCLLFFSLNLILFLPLNFLINVDSSVKFYFWMANFFLTVIFYLFLISQLWKSGNHKRQFSPG